MKQSRLASFSESAINIAVGFGISFVAQLVFLPMLGVTINLTQNTAFALIMTVISLARSYILRRLFEYFQIRIPLSPGALAIIAERRRQVDVEGWTPEHDLAHSHGELSRAGAAYLLFGAGLPDLAKQAWPWPLYQFKPKDDERKNAVRGAALGLAELDRMVADRKQIKGGSNAV